MIEDTKSNVDLVITAPENLGVALAYHARCRTTLGVLMQLISESHDRVMIGAPFIQAEYSKPAELLKGALIEATKRGVIIDLISTGLGLNVAEKLLSAADTNSCIRLFRPHPKLTTNEKLGLHAKFCVADGCKAYVGSANLTGPGLSEHMEMGVLIRGHVAKQIEDFWRYCIEIRLLIEEV